MELHINVGAIDTSIANAIRRTMISSIDTLAIDKIKITENNGLLPDEMIAHRLGLIPLKRHSEYVKEASFTLDVRNDTDELMTIYSSSICIDNPDDVSIPDQNIILTKLDHGHQIKLEAYATIGTGTIHAKWNHTAGISFELNEDNTYTFHIETLGTIEPKEVLKESIDYLIEKVSFYENADF